VDGGARSVLGAAIPRPRRSSRSRKAGTAAVGDAFGELLRTIRKVKARGLAAGGSDVQSVRHLLLQTVVEEGPLRAGVLAAHVESDASTVSRHVAALVRSGLLTRRADQGDGRSSLLTLTDAGRAVAAEIQQASAQFYAQTLAGWQIDELYQFADLLDRFIAAYDQTYDAWMADHTTLSPIRSRPEGRKA
jgi:DNA-binding MarR family transcriptional regulator